MPVWLRRTLIALAVLLALLVAAAAYLIASFDPNRYKGLLIDWVHEHKGRTLVIDGPIGLDVFPRLQVTLKDVRLSEHGRPDDTFASLKKAQLSVQVMPLLHQQLAVDRIAARGVRATYTRDAQGHSNIDDLLTSDEPAGTKQPAPEAGSSKTALRFDVSAIELHDLQAEVHDAVAGVDGSFVVQEFTSGRLADGAKSPIRFVGQAKLTKPELDAQIDLAAKLKLALPPGAPAHVGLSDLKLALEGDGFGVKDLDAKLEGGLDYDGASGALKAKELALKVSGQGFGAALKDSKLTLDKLLFDPAKRALRLEALNVDLAGHHGNDALAAKLSWPKLEVTGDKLVGSALKGSASLIGGGADKTTMKLAFESQAPSGSFERIRVPGLKASVEGGGAGRSVKGQVTTDLTLAPKPLAAALDALDVQLAFADPALPPMTLALRGQAKYGGNAASWQLDGSINQQAFNSSGKADLAKAVPRIDAQARFAALDLTRFVRKTAAAGSGSGAGAGAASTPAPAAAGAAADVPVDLSGLKAIDGTFSLHAGSLVYPPYKVSDAVLNANISSGLLKVTQLSGGAWGGRFNAQASAQAAAQPAGQKVTLKLDTTDIDIARLLSDVAQFKRLEGRGKFNADVATSGGSVNAFKRALDGKAALQLRDGAVRGINLAKVLRQWRSAITGSKDAVQAASNDEKTDFSAITASFDIKDGVAHNNDLDAKSPFLRVGGEGVIDIGRSRIDYLAKATVTGTPEGQGGADLEALKGVTVPVQLVGPFDAVQYHVQWSKVAADLVGKRAKDAIKEKAKGALKGKLGGVLGGVLGTEPADGAASAAEPKKKKDAIKEGLGRLLGR